MTLLPDEDTTPDPDVDTNIPLAVVPDDLPPHRAAAALRDAAEWVDSELARLRRQRAERDREGLAEIDAMRRRLIADREAVNAEIKALAVEQVRLARVLRAYNR